MAHISRSALRLVAAARAQSDARLSLSLSAAARVVQDLEKRRVYRTHRERENVVVVSLAARAPKIAPPHAARRDKLKLNIRDGEEQAADCTRGTFDFCKSEKWAGNFVGWLLFN